ncbi:uncharacterized protein LOC110730922 isoform X1 [Chenopodium quinoa]|uniref:uncharacterized protein LOC110730922 isoform X1 n=1 Tax=Chenopodium quinoa TaxID=63459 RepID=UPI000B77C05C|nr:uncharacterized protein LOC110730922 isoform X1 [Chenopodium quinoa]
MCMFCVIQKWSRRVATMLPWLVIPLIGLWALSQLLPPAFRFEITSPRLACVFVLLVTLFWYEVLMPQLSAWRVRRNARLRERKRNEALELQKLKKTATRKCRNCLTPYRDQNPGGGKFMCSYCGHISKRPVLDLPVPPGISNSGILKELLGKGGKILNGKPWSDNVSLCSQEWVENGSWVVNGSFPVKASFPPRKNGVGLYGRSESCLAEKSYSGVYLFSCKLLTSFLLSIRWLWRKLFRISSSEDSSSDGDHGGGMSKKGENGSTGQESRGEKARRKAEEKRQARIERELLEEEERKQREEVARLVEERRKLRDEKIEAENRAKGTSSLREKDSKREAEKRRQERRKEKDKGSSKSNSDVDELEKKSGKENDRKRDTERKHETDRRESPKSGVDGVKGQNTEAGYGAKGNSTNNFSRVNVGARYFDRVRGTFLSSSKALTGSSFFGKAAPSHVPASKEMKPNSSVENSLVSNSKRDFLPPEHLPGKTIMNADDKSHTRPVSSDIQHKTQPKSWQQLFTQAPPSHPNVISRPSANSAKSQVSQSSQLPCSVSSTPLYDNPINLPSPFMLPAFSSGPLTNNSSPPVAKDPFFPSVSDMSHDFFMEEPEHFEDPCYEPDPVSLLGPVSESLDNFQLDRGNSFVKDGIGNSCPMINVSTPLDVTRPSPIESPLSRLRVADEKPNNHSHFSSSPRGLDMHFFPAADMNDNINDKGTWHMWNSSPLGPDGLSLVGGSASWISPLERSRLNSEDMMHQSPQKTMASLFTNESRIASGTHSPQKATMGNAQSYSAFGVSASSSNDQDQWMQKAFYPPLCSSELNLPASPTEEASESKLLFGSPGRAAANGLDPSTVSWSNRNEWSVQGIGEGVTNPSIVRSPFGGLYSSPNVHSLWSFE